MNIVDLGFKASPFPHLVMEDVLSDDDYNELSGHWEDATRMEGIRNHLKENRIPAIDFRWKPELAGRLKAIFGVDGAISTGRYMLRREGYELKPHLDPPNTLLTVIHYLPLAGSDESLGTVLYEAAEPLACTRPGANYFECACTPAKRVMARRNSLLAFLNTPLSAHGLPRLPEARLAFQWHILET